MAHAQFETIHPFVDGNGRVGRALIHIVLRRRGLCTQAVPPVSLALATFAKDYVKELAAYRHVGSPDGEEAVAGLCEWLSFFSGCAVRSCRDAEEFERRLGRLKEGWIDSLPAKPTEGVLAIADEMAGRPLFTASQMAEATGKSMPTVNDAIRRLEDAGAVKQVNAGKRNRAFEAEGVIELFTNFERTLASIADDTAAAKPSHAVPLSFSDASELWGLSESTLRKAVSYGKIVPGVDARKYGKQWVVTRDAMSREYGDPVTA